jgi:HemY protein
MKTLFKLLLPLIFPLLVCIAVGGLAFYWLSEIDTSGGTALLGIGHWSIETTLATLVVGIVILFFIVYVLFRLMIYLIKLPGQLKHRSRSIKFNRSQEALIAGLVDSAEGNWERAENVLIKHASHSGAPLLHYLTAAKAAQSRGAIEKRDEYLKQATALSPDASIAVGLTQAELHLSGNEFDQALQTLTQLYTVNPAHASVLKLLHQTYQSIGDWNSVRKLLPSLHKNKVLMEAEVKLLEVEAFSKLLRQAAETGEASAIQQLWAEVPNHVRKVPGISAIYFAAMINADAGDLVEDELAIVLATDWDATLLVLYGSIRSSDILKQLAMAERWLSIHPKDAVLLAVLGKLCIECADLERAVSYLAQSIAAEPTVQAYQLLGDLYSAQDDKDRASECYKNGLMLASSEIVGRIDTIS